MVSVAVSQRLDRELSWPQYRGEFHPSRTYTSDGNPMLVSQCGKTQKHLAYTFRIRRQARRLHNEPVFPLPHPLQTSLADFNVGSLGT
jgi:hypothetical protein